MAFRQEKMGIQKLGLNHQRLGFDIQPSNNWDSTSKKMDSSSKR
jgi:hypothetical protein